MDIKEIKDEIVVLERNLSDLLMQFEEPTDLKIEKVYADRMARDGWVQKITAHITCRIN
jgi:hypothetical protein